ncbi:MAG: dephospho-CoA kinase [Nitrospiraceae bacterium]
MLFSAAMILVGLTGGVATGKSSVAHMFQRCGAAVIDADVLARQVVEPGKPAWREIVDMFGRQILRPDRAIDRHALAHMVFRNPVQLKQLGAIIHPRVAREQARLTREIAAKDPRAVIIYDAPVLIEAAAHRRMDKIIVVTADQRTQISRLQKRNGFSRAEALRRIRSQIPLWKKIELADHVIDGARPIEKLRREVKLVYRAISRLA